MNKKLKIIIISICCILALAILQTLPVFFLKPLGAREIKGKNIIVFYQPGDDKDAKEVYDVLEYSAEEIRGKLEFDSSKPTTAYLYSSQKSLWIRKYGLITILAAPVWFIGDNKGDKILLVSPNAKVNGNDHNSILGAAIHELVHTINYQINPSLSYWNDNGIATFLAKQKPDKETIQFSPTPTLDDTRSEDEVKFGEVGGYQYSYTYIEFLNHQYGWNKVLDLVRGEKTYDSIFSKSEEDIYNEWLEYLNKYYKN